MVFVPFSTTLTQFQSRQTTKTKLMATIARVCVPSSKSRMFTFSALNWTEVFYFEVPSTRKVTHVISHHFQFISIVSLSTYSTLFIFLETRSKQIDPYLPHKYFADIHSSPLALDKICELLILNLNCSTTYETRVLELSSRPEKASKHRRQYLTATFYDA